MADLYDVRPPLRTRYGDALLLVVVALAVAGALAAYIAGRMDGETAGVFATVAAAIAALVFNALQSRSTVEERSLDGLYARIDLANRLYLETGDERRSDDGVSQTALHRRYRYYVFTELDNLELAVAKYARGVLSATAASRALRTFEQRCSVPTFASCVRQQIEDPSYMDTTRSVVDRILRRQ